MFKKTLVVVAASASLFFGAAFPAKAAITPPGDHEWCILQAVQARNQAFIEADKIFLASLKEADTKDERLAARIVYVEARKNAQETYRVAVINCRIAWPD